MLIEDTRKRAFLEKVKWFRIISQKSFTFYMCFFTQYPESEFFVCCSTPITKWLYAGSKHNIDIVAAKYKIYTSASESSFNSN